MLALHTNLKNSATTQLAGFDFNSFCKFGGNYLGCKSGGVHLLEGNDFDGTDISAQFKTFINQLGYEANKRVRFIYLGVETDGILKITPTVDGVDKTAITITPSAAGKQHLRVSVGRDVHGRYWSFKVENVDGCWFSIDEVSVLPVYLHKGHR